MIGKLLEPFFQIWTQPAQQIHPQLVHFPIVFLVLEAVLLLLSLAFRKQELSRFATISLHCAFWSLLLAAVFGLHDVGLDLGTNNKIWMGIQDRWENAFRWESSITVHAWLAMGLIVLTLVRLLLRSFTASNLLCGPKGVIFGLLTFFNLWVLLATAYVGGMISHK